MFFCDASPHYIMILNVNKDCWLTSQVIESTFKLIIHNREKTISHDKYTIGVFGIITATRHTSQSVTAGWACEKVNLLDNVINLEHLGRYSNQHTQCVYLILSKPFQRYLHLLRQLG